MPQFEQAKAFIQQKLQHDLPAHLYYHSTAHVADVYEAAGMLADAEGVSPEDKLLLLTAVMYHDSGFMVGPKEHEAEGCNIARKYLPDFDYSEEQIGRICGMIMATRIPQTPHNLLEEIICDADLDYLGRDDFFPIGNRLFAELRVYAIVRAERDWNELQVRFLESHRYFTKTAIDLRQEKKATHLRHLKKLLAA